MGTIDAANAAISLLEWLIPKLEEEFKKGTISPEEQQATLDKYNALKNKADGLFNGPEWGV